MHTSDVDRYGDRSGVALAAAIYAIVILGTMLSVSFFIGLQDQRAGRNSVKVRGAYNAAEGGAEQVLTDWDRDFNRLVIGDSSPFVGWLPDSTGWYRGNVHRIGKSVFFVRAEGFSFDSTSRSSVGLVAKLRFPQIDIRSAFETQGETEIGGNAIISGIDTIPPGITDCPPLTNVPGLFIQEDDDIDFQGINHEERGIPPIMEDLTISDSSLTTFGEQTLTELAGAASHTMTPNTDGSAYKIQPSLAGGECNESDPNNWGEPLTLVPECEPYFPLVYSPGDLHINMDRGQGMLIVDGDLHVKGQFRFYGIALVRGKLVTEGTGGHFFGGVIAANVDDEDNRVAGNAQMYYSSCAILDALSGTSPGERLRERSWTRIY